MRGGGASGKHAGFRDAHPGYFMKQACSSAPSNAQRRKAGWSYRIHDVKQLLAGEDEAILLHLHYVVKYKVRNVVEKLVRSRLLPDRIGRAQAALPRLITSEQRVVNHHQRWLERVRRSVDRSAW
jgi:hypothetical protein